MALNESLARFWLLQERNQATLSAIAATRTSSSSSAKPCHQQPAPTSRPAAKPSTSAPAPAAVVRFSDDTARLQKINDVRRSTVGRQMKTVIDLLDKTREALTAHQINEQTYVDIDGNRTLAESLRNNPKVRFDGQRFSYKPTHDVAGKAELLTLIKSFPDGLPASEVKKAYPAVEDDLRALGSSGDVYLLPGEGGIVAYPNDPRLRTMEVDAELKKLFHEVKLPREMLDIEKELRKSGEEPATDTMKRRAAEQVHGGQPNPKKAKKKSRGITSRTKLTNVHLPWLLDLPVDSKDFI
ncbi:General transcription factor IIE subunit 2 [Hordeum vulgare]|uniref:general transcription factor IIE subunit 2-like n=1 Tax=Hordeum vulgare subsp. vulgare TaxID=112509 RepID=UPI001D1A333E|nr:general transcription factor IIE subunit 2-like [Hordeum vulgare subsp. vulgare]KAE8769543.1 General transcription factor IIE subunit 2 [Hordeum vulgare]